MIPSNGPSVPEELEREEVAAKKDSGLWRDLTAYWILGLCNNYGYVVMLSAAYDIISRFSGREDDEPSDDEPIRDETKRICNIISTGAILLADILPSFLIKIIAPFLPFYVHLRIGIAVGLQAAGFLLVAFAENEWMAIFGVILTSLSSGLGELTFLSYSARYNKNVVSTWSSGTGGAGIIGSLSYAGLISLGVGPIETILIMLIVPVLEAAVFWLLLRSPSDPKPVDNEPELDEEKPLIGFKNKLRYMPSLFRYMIPIMLVYLFEYFINQGLFELIYFEGIWLDHETQYRWLQVDYQIGVFISRSSVNLVQIKQVWIMAALQFANIFVLLFEVIYFYMPSIWLVFAFVLWEGLLGGGAYVNTFYRISHEVPRGKRDFALQVVPVSDSIGIAIAGILAIPTHNALCALPAPIR